MSSEPTSQPGPVAGIYRVLDELLAHDRLAPGTLRTLHDAVDELRSASPGSVEIGIAEKISVAVYRLECALRARDATAADDARTKLDELRRDWMNGRILERA